MLEYDRRPGKCDFRAVFNALELELINATNSEQPVVLFKSCRLFSMHQVRLKAQKLRFWSRF